VSASGRGVQLIDRDPKEPGNRAQLHKRRGLSAGLDVADVRPLAIEGNGDIRLGQPAGGPALVDAPADGTVDPGDLVAVHTGKDRQAIHRSQPHPIDIFIGRAVRARREAASRTQLQLARVLGVTRGRVGQLENGWPWTAAQVYLAAAWLGTSPGELMDAFALTESERSLIEAVRAKHPTDAMERLLALVR